MGFEVVIACSLVTLAAAIQYVLPALTRPDLFFGITVNAAFRSSAEGAAVLRRYRTQVLISAVLAIAVALAAAKSTLAPPVAIVTVAFGWALAYFGARRRVMPHAATPTTEREALIERRRTGVPVMLQAGPFVLLAGVALYLGVHWNELPPRFAVHWGPGGMPNGWAARSLGGVFAPLLVAAVCCAFLLLITLAISRARRIHATGALASAEHRFRTTIMGIVVAVEWIIAMTFGFVAALPLRADPTREPPIAVVVLPVLLVITIVVVQLRMGQGGSRLAPTPATEPPVGDRTGDRYWKGGLFYVNRDDPAWLVEKRFGFGYTLNFGNPRAWVAFAIVMAFLAASIFLPRLL